MELAPSCGHRNGSVRCSPKREQARQWLRSRISKGEVRLPPVRLLAAQAGVSLVTMHRAVQDLCASGELRAHGGDAVYTAAGWEARIRLRPSVSRPHNVAIAFRRDLVEGRYAPGSPLPSRKELAETYGTGARTLRLALRQLLDEGVLLVDRRTLYRPRLLAPPGNRRLLVLARGWSEGGLARLTPRTIDFVHRLQLQCQRVRMESTIVSLYFRESQLVLPSALLRRSRADIAGVALLSAGLARTELERLSALVGASGLPLVIVDETGAVAEQTLAQHHGSPLQLVTYAHDHSSGVAVGRFLQELGHRHIAVINHRSDQLFARNRLQGLRQVYTTSPHVSLYELEFSFASPPGLIRLRSPLHRRLSGGDSARLDEQMRLELRTLLSRLGLCGALVPQLPALLARPEISAWVCVNDESAAHCQAFLYRQGAKVALLAIEDTPEMQARGISGYRFDVDAAVGHTMAFVLQGDGLKRGSNAARTIRVEGFVVARSSTA